MNEIISQLKKEVDLLKSWKSSLENSFSIPLNIDQSFRRRFLSSNVILYCGTFTTLGGDASETITGLSGVGVNDIAIVTLKSAGGTPRTIIASAAAADSISITFSGDPSTDHVVNYLVIRK